MGIVFILGITPVLYAIWILTEPLLSCLIIPILQFLLNIPFLIIEGLIELNNNIIGGLKKLSLFYDKKKDKPIIDNYENLEAHEIQLIESVFKKRGLDEKQARHYLSSLLSIKNHISSNI
jgi:hypothetical protein